MVIIEFDVSEDEYYELKEEMESYNRKFNPKEKFDDVGKYIKFILSVLERDVY